MKHKYILLLLAMLVFSPILAAARLGENWTEATYNADWSIRSRHTMTAHNNSMWVIGGYNPYWLDLSDVWNSSNGATWTRQSNSIGTREGHTAVSFNNKLCLIGGYIELSGAELNDTLCSQDGQYYSVGQVWDTVNSSNAFPGRDGHGSVVFDNAVWVIGGTDNNGNFNDVWKSNGTDMGNWTEEVHNSPWNPRLEFGLTVFQNKPWLFGGLTWDDGYGNMAVFNDSWSFNGTDWVLESSNVNWSARWGHEALTLGNEVCIIGGSDLQDNDKNDVWCSGDGKNFSLRASNANFSARRGHAGTVFDDNLWISGGNSTGTFMNDVWYDPNNKVNKKKEVRRNIKTNPGHQRK